MPYRSSQSSLIYTLCTWEAEAGGLLEVHRQTGLHTKFQAILNYSVRRYVLWLFQCQLVTNQNLKSREPVLKNCPGCLIDWYQVQRGDLAGNNTYYLATKVTGHQACQPGLDPQNPPQQVALSPTHTYTHPYTHTYPHILTHKTLTQHTIHAYTYTKIYRYTHT